MAFVRSTSMCLLMVSLLCIADTYAKTVLQARDDFTSLWKNDKSWAVQQRKFSCGLVWLNQTAYGRSTYTVSSIYGAESCVNDDKAFVQLVEIGSGPRLTHLFEALCMGKLEASEYSKHTTAQASLEWESLGDSLTSMDTVYLMVRNECAEDVTITIKHDVDLVLVVPWSWAVVGFQMLLVSLVVMAGVFAILAVRQQYAAKPSSQLMFAKIKLPMKASTRDAPSKQPEILVPLLHHLQVDVQPLPAEPPIGAYHGP